MRLQWWMWVLWPAFLCACALEFIVFGLVDPQEALHHFDVDRKAVYALAFVVFWGVCSIGTAMALWFSDSEKSIEQNNT
jgi:di/tricarboxylate transporter